MRVSEGQLVRVTLELHDAERLHPMWLVGALAAAYPAADVVSVTPSGNHAFVVLSARNPFDAAVGKRIAPLTEGLPGEFTTHSAHVTAVEPLTAPSSDPEPSGNSDLLKLGLAAVMISTVAYAIHRIGAKGEHARAA
jgi:hypothetical protein